MISKSLMKKSGIYLIGNLSSKIMSALLIPIYAFSVSVNDLGYFDFSQTIMGILSPIIILAIWEAILKFVLIEDNLEKKRKIITTSAIFSIFVAILFLLFTIIIKQFLVYTLDYFYLIILMIVLHSLVYVWQYYARANGEDRLYISAGILATIINFLLIIVLVVFFNLGLLGLLIAYNVSQFSIILIIENKLRVISNLELIDFDFKLLKKMILFSSPLVLNLISAWFISGFGRLIVTLELGSESNGLYSFAIKFSLVITMLGTVITMAIIEEAIMAVKSKKFDESFNKTLESLFQIFQSITLIAVPLILIFYHFISDTDYYNSLELAPWLLLYAVANTMASNMGSVFQAIDKTKYQFITTLLGAFVTIVISYSLIHVIGVIGVITGQVLGAITMLLSRYILINKFVKLKIFWLPIILRLLSFVIITFICINSNLMVNVFIELLLLIFFYYMNRKIVSKFLFKLKGKLVR